MSSFTPALGRSAPTRFYDHVAPRPADVIADVGCGTGSLALLPARGKPLARIVGFDPDPEVLALARPQNLSSSGRG